MGDNAFSVVANSFAVVGLTDVVARLSITAIDFYVRFRNASKDIERILLELRTLADLVRRVRDWADDYSNPNYVLDDGDAPLSELQTVLENCERELNELIRVSQKAKQGANEGWVKTLSKRIWWAQGDQEFQKSCRAIQRLNATLNTALSLIGRQNDLVVRQQLKAVRNDLSGTRSAINESSQTISSEVQQVSTGIQSLHESNSTLLVRFDSSFSSTHAELKSISTTITDNAMTLGRRISSIDKTLIENAANQSTLVHQQNESFSQIAGRFDELTSQLATIGLMHSQKNEIVFEGQYPGAITLPLELVRPHLANAIQTLVADGTMALSEATWFESEFENILACGHEAVAFAGRHKSVTCQKFPDCHGSQSQFSLTSFKKASSQVSWRHSYSEVLPFQQNSVREVQDLRKFQTPVGRLVVETCRASPGNSTYIGPSFSSLGVWYTPNPQLTSCVITTRFSKLSIPSVEPKITRAVQMYNVIPRGSPALRYVDNNDVQGLKRLFEAGQASVYDCDETGASLLWRAARGLCVETYEYLLHQGASCHYSFEGFVLLHLIWATFFQAFSAEEVIKQTRKMTTSAIQRGCDPNDTIHSENLLHFMAGGELDLENTRLSQVCSYLLTIGCELEQRDDWSRTPLLAAACYGNSKLFRVLLSKGADLNARDVSNRGALHMIFEGISGMKQRAQYRDLLETALLEGCDPNSLDDDGFSPSSYSARSGSWDIWTEALDLKGYTPVNIGFGPGMGKEWIVLSKGALGSQTLPISNLTINQWIAKCGRISSYCYTPLHHAAANGDSEAAVALLKLNMEANYAPSNGWTPLHLAAYHGHVEIAKQLHVNGAQLEAQTQDGIAPLHQAARSGQSDIVAWLLELNVDINCVSNNGWTPLHFASCNGHLKVAKQLYAKGAQLEAQTKHGFTPLHQATSNCHSKVVTWLIEELNVDVNCASNRGWTPLHTAAKKGYLEIAKQLYAKGAQINARTKQGLIPLHSAVVSGHSNVVTWLVEELNVDVNCVSNDGWTPLHSAAEMGHLTVANGLIDFQANVEVESNGGWTPLHMAARRGHLAVANRLVTLGADPNRRSHFGSTPFHCAVYRGKVALLEMFLHSSGDPWLLDGYGRNILDWASTYPPAFKVMEGLHQFYEPTNQSTISQHVTMTIQKLLQSSNRGADWLELIGLLFIRIGEDVEATTAFEQLILSDRSDLPIVHHVQCEMCETYPIQGLRYVCRVCADTSLCESCMARYDDGVSVRDCNKHAFLKVPSQTWKTLKQFQVNEKGEALEEWLERLKQRWIGDLPGH